MKNALAVIVIVLLGLIFYPSVAFSKADRSWKEDNKLILDGKVDDCLEKWEILWYWAKQGNLEARFTLLVSIVSLPDMGETRMPGNDGNYISNLRDVVTMAVHSSAYKGDGTDDSVEFVRSYKMIIKEFFLLAGFPRMSGGEEFLKCINEDVDQDCSALAIKNGLVPSFESYSMQIDASLSKGMLPYCSAHHIRD